jgi:hypothetical protein
MSTNVCAKEMQWECACLTRQEFTCTTKYEFNALHFIFVSLSALRLQMCAQHGTPFPLCQWYSSLFVSSISTSTLADPNSTLTTSNQPPPPPHLFPMQKECCPKNGWYNESKESIDSENLYSPPKPPMPQNQPFELQSQ